MCTRVITYVHILWVWFLQMEILLSRVDILLVGHVVNIKFRETICSINTVTDFELIVFTTAQCPLIACSILHAIIMVAMVCAVRGATQIDASFTEVKCRCRHASSAVKALNHRLDIACVAGSRMMKVTKLFVSVQRPWQLRRNLIARWVNMCKSWLIHL